MDKKEEKAKESIQAFFLCKTKKYGCRFVEKCMYCDGNSGASECDENCSADEYFAGFCSGWDAFDALMGGLLTNVKERQPEPNEEVICRMVSNGAFVSGYIYQEDGKYKVATSPDFHFEGYGDYECDYWFPKPKLIEVNHE